MRTYYISKDHFETEKIQTQNKKKKTNEIQSKISHKKNESQKRNRLKFELRKKSENDE